MGDPIYPKQQADSVYPKQQAFAQPPPVQVQYDAPPTYNQSQAGTSGVVVVQHTTLAPWQASPFRETPVRVLCQHCCKESVTYVEYEIGTFTYAASGMICLVGFWFGLWCCCIPCCMKSCKDVIHKCPHCNQEVGRYERMK